MSDIVKVEIAQNRDNFKKRFFSYREEKINCIIDDPAPIVPREDVYGCIYTSNDYFPSSVPIKSISHVIKDVFVENEKYYAIISLLKTPGTEKYYLIKKEYLLLKPLYYPSGEMATLSISINMKMIHNNILNRK